MNEQVKPGFTNYQPQPKYSWALSKIEGKGKLVKTKCLKISGSLKISESLKNSESLKCLKISERILRFTMHRTQMSLPCLIPCRYAAGKKLNQKLNVPRTTTSQPKL